MASKKVKPTYMKNRLRQALETGGLSRDLGSAIRWALSVIDSHARKIQRLEAVEATQQVEIRLLQDALLCKDCGGIGWVYCAVADVSTPCRNCTAYDIREAAKAGGDDE